MTPFPNPAPFSPGDQFTSDYCNQLVDAVLAKLQAESFDFLAQFGDKTLFTHNVSADKDEIIRFDSYSNIRVYTGSQNVFFLLQFTDPNGNVATLSLNELASEGFSVNFSYTLKAKHGTQVLLNIQGTVDGVIYDCGGALTILKSVGD